MNIYSLREKEGTLTELQNHTEIEVHKMQNDRSVENLYLYISVSNSANVQ